MSQPLRITFEQEDYTYNILTKGINKDSVEIRIILNNEEYVLIKNSKGEWSTSDHKANTNVELINSIVRAIGLRYRL
jgi:hypothetical protein